jgi:hypothetical protein
VPFIWILLCEVVFVYLRAPTTIYLLARAINTSNRGFLEATVTTSGPTVLTGLQQATNTLAPTDDSISGTAAGDVAGLVSKAKPQEKAYIDALNAYASQFGGQSVPQS